jgi:serine/threonine-protein kinase
MTEKIGKYTLLERVGRGGMGTVYKAHDPVLNRAVALKVISGEVEVGEELKARFFREARACDKLNHPNIIVVYDLGEDKNRLFIVMEFLEGDELKTIIAERRRLPIETKLGLMIQICDGLHYAHQHGVIHRDVKPGNIFVLRNGQVRILDFGIARIAASDPGLTRTGLIMGTLRYMSPEQARGRVDQRSDIFSVGAVFYELLAYRPAFDRDNPIEILEQLRAEHPPALTELDPTVPPELAAIIERALMKSPDDRFQDLGQMRDALELVLRQFWDRAAEVRAQVMAQLDDVRELRAALANRLGQGFEDSTLPVVQEDTPLHALYALHEELARRQSQLRSLVDRTEAMEPRLAQGLELLARGRAEEAISELEGVLREMPRHVRAEAALTDARRLATQQAPPEPQIEPPQVASLQIQASALDAPRPEPAPAEPPRPEVSGPEPEPFRPGPFQTEAFRIDPSRPEAPGTEPPAPEPPPVPARPEPREMPDAVEAPTVLLDVATVSSRAPGPRPTAAEPAPATPGNVPGPAAPALTPTPETAAPGPTTPRGAPPRAARLGPGPPPPPPAPASVPSGVRRRGLGMREIGIAAAVVVALGTGGLIVVLRSPTAPPTALKTPATSTPTPPAVIAPPPAPALAPVPPVPLEPAPPAAAPPPPAPAPPAEVAPPPLPAAEVAEFERLRAAAAAARQEAATAGAERLAPATLAPADDKAREAEAAFADRDLERARALLSEALDGYRRAATGSRGTADVRRVQAEATEARRAAEGAQASRLAPAPWERGNAAQREAEDAVKRRDLDKAGPLFRDAAKAFREAEVLATRAALSAATTERERSAALRRDREAAEQAAAAAGAARRQAEEAGAARWAPKALVLAQDKEKEGQAAIDRQDFGAARDRFREAQQEYQRARQDTVASERRELGREDQVRQEAEQGRTQVAQARGLAEQADARRLAPKPWTDAVSRETDGQAALGRRDYATARERFREAHQEYQRAAQEARDVALRREAEQLRAETVDKRALAEQADARRLAPRPWTDASAKEAAAQAALGRRDLAGAIQGYREARQEYQRAAVEARQATEASRRQDAAPTVRPADPAPGAPTPPPRPGGQPGGGLLGAVKRALGGELKGASGSVAWEVVGVRTDTLAAEVRWSYTLVLRETTGTAIQFERVVRSVARGDDGGARVTEERFQRRLEARAELRLPASDAVAYTAGTAPDSLREGVTVFRRFYGKDDKGREIVVDVQFRL